MTLTRAFWLVFTAGTLVYLAMVLWTLPSIAEQAGGLMPFDLRPSGYSLAEAQAFLSALSDDGRALYHGPQRMLDILYPGLLAATLVMGYLLLLPRRFALAASPIAVLSALFDWTENVRVARLLSVDPVQVSDALVTSASRMTVLKSVTVTCAMVIFLLGLGLAAWRWIKARRA